MDLIEWVEGQAKENLQSRIDNLDKLITDANGFLKIILAGLSAASVYLLKIHASGNPEGWLSIGLIVTSVYLFLMATVLIIKCLKADVFYPPTNEPRNLYQKEYDLLAIRETELDNTQENIDFMVVRNTGIADWLDRVKMLIIFTPVVFLLTALVVVYL